MSKHISETMHLAAQTIPFLAITASFIIIVYVYGHALAPINLDSPFDASKINFCNFL